MKKTLLTAVVAIMIAIVGFKATNVMAGSLDDVVNEAEQKDSSITNSDNDNGDNLAKTIYDVGIQNSDMSGIGEEAQKVAPAIYRISKFITQVIIICIFALIPITLLLDVGYVFVPIGRTGASKSGNGVGNSGYGNSYGGGAYGGYNNSFGGSAYGSGESSGVQQDGKNKFLGFPVSNEAIQIGNMQSPFTEKVKMLAKDTMLRGICTVAFIVLVATGLLQKLGGVVGGAVGNAICEAIGLF